MAKNLSSLYQEIPPKCTAYDYDDPRPPFSPKSIAAIDSIKAFLSPSELSQARRLETVYYAPILGDGTGTFIPGLREYSTSRVFYVGRFNDQRCVDMLKGFLDAIYRHVSRTDFHGVTWPWFRVTTPDGRRSYPLQVNDNFQGWKDQLTKVTEELGTTLAWFDRGKFCLADGRRFAFGDLTIDRLEGGKPVPKGW